MPWWGLGAACAGFASGVLCGVLVQPVGLAAGVAAVAATLAAAAWRGRAVLVAAVLACFLLGLLRALAAAPGTLPPAVVGRAIAVLGQVDDDPVTRARGERITIAVDHLRGPSGVTPATFRMITTLYGIARVGAGDQVLLTGVLREPSRFEQFDYRTFLADEGIIAVLDSPRLVQSAPGSPDPLHAAIFAIRHALIDAVDRTLPEPDAALVLGVVFGYRAALPTVLDQAMIQSGLIHIVVISGLKVSLLARLVQRALGRVWPRAAPIVALTAMVAYALVAGASAAALRAAAMGALVVIAGVVRRESQVYVSLALTAALMLGLKPALAHDVSFQLSFAGTLGIATMTDPIAARLRMMPGVLRDPFSATCAAEIATWPLMLANFHQVSVIGPVANALVLPLLPAIIVLGGLGALVAILVQPVGSTLLQGAGLIATWFQVVITWTAGLPGAAITAPYFPVRWLLAAGVLNGGALAALKLRVFLWQRRVWAGAGGLALIATALLLVRPDGRLHVYALDVGSGSAVLVRTPSGEQVLIDAGPDPNLVAQALGRALPPTARRLTAWIVTGGRLDEIGGAQAILDRFQVDRVIIAEVKPWSVTLRALVDRAQTLGITVQTTIAAVGVDGVVLEPMPDERTWLVWQGGAALAIVPPDTDWVRLPRGVEGAVFTQGGPAEWGPSDGRGVAVVQVAAHSRAGLPARAFLRGLGPGPVLRTDRLGTVELVAGSAGFQPAG